MSEMQSYTATLQTPEVGDFEGFASSPATDELRGRIEYLVRQEWTPVVEHIESDRSAEHYWSMWKLPMFGQRDVDAILSEIKLCRTTHPDHVVRILGYDNTRRTLGARIVVDHDHHSSQDNSMLEARN